MVYDMDPNNSATKRLWCNMSSNFKNFMLLIFFSAFIHKIIGGKANGVLFVLGFNDMSTLVGHSLSSPREREKRDRRDSGGDEREGQGRKRKMNEIEETEEIKTFPLYPYLLQRQQAMTNCKPILVGRPSDARYMTPLPHPTTPSKWCRC